MRNLTNDEIFEILADRLRKTDVFEEPEMAEATVANIIAAYHELKNEDVETNEKNEQRSQLKTELFARVAELNDELETRLSKLGYRKDLFKFEVNEDDYRPWEKVELIDYNGKTVLSKSVYDLDEFEKWSEDIMIKIETFAYLVSEFYDRLAQEGSEVDGLRIKHRDTYHCLEVAPSFKAGYAHVGERIPLEVLRNSYLLIDTSDDSFVSVHGDNLSADFVYHKSNVPINEIDDVMDEIDRLYNSIKGE